MSRSVVYGVKHSNDCECCGVAQSSLDAMEIDLAALTAESDALRAENAVLRGGVERAAARHDDDPPPWEINACWHNEAELLRKLLASTPLSAKAQAVIETKSRALDDALAVIDHIYRVADGSHEKVIAFPEGKELLALVNRSDVSRAAVEALDEAQR